MQLCKMELSTTDHLSTNTSLTASVIVCLIFMQHATQTDHRQMWLLQPQKSLFALHLHYHHNHFCSYLLALTYPPHLTLNLGLPRL